MKFKRAGKDATPADGAGAVPAKSAKSNLIPAIIVAVGLLGGGFFMKSGPAPTPAEAAEHKTEKSEHAEVKEEPTHGPVQNIEPMTLNLADGHFLKVGLALQLPPAEGGHGAAEELPSAKALDIAITLLGNYTMNELSSPKTRELVKKKLSEEVSKAYVDPLTEHPLVTKVYFTEFVMQ